jgi:hypothetical protein
MYFRTTKGKVIMNQGFFGGEIENWLLSGYLDRCNFILYLGNADTFLENMPHITMELRKVVLYMYNISFVKEFLRILTIYF